MENNFHGKIFKQPNKQEGKEKQPKFDTETNSLFQLCPGISEVSQKRN
jgi:hypothetical protein